MLLADVARTSRQVAATSARSEKIAALAGLFRRTEPAEAPVVITYLAGKLPQRRTGVGWSTLRQRHEPAAAPRLAVLDVDRALSRIAAVSGTGAGAERRRLVGALMADATEDEQRFLLGLIGGELRQGALEALAVEGLAQAVGAPPAEVRRAVMLGGSLGAVAEALLARGPAALADFRLEVGRPVLPMLAQSAADLDEAMDRLGPCVIEEKAGRHTGPGAPGRGRRTRLHPHPGRDHRPAARGRKRRSSELAKRRAVLDGEVISLDEAGRPRPFQETSAQKRLPARHRRGVRRAAAVPRLLRPARRGRPRPPRAADPRAPHRTRPGGPRTPPGAAAGRRGPGETRRSGGRPANSPPMCWPGAMRASSPRGWRPRTGRGGAGRPG
ncbi:DNA ligase I, ATP-dependent (Dnl1) [Streptomyces himastatinicus ATCC 53653]|uniref:DNA ligase I, ATP-dependent (Dnl1) n=1 Tax=Streptomyces himastatinicus ATCC 53653 TaxID=457427 RepID=D9W6R2_9ACTN|nr:DNA ligase I, ATP-dependent (Dnl1) [Streptomyces himastatinicus ATCC 53653]